MTETKEDIFNSEIDPEVAIIQEDHTEDNTVIETWVMVDNRGLEVNPDSPLEDLELHQGLFSRDKDRFFSCRQFGHFVKECPEKDTSAVNIQCREERLNKHRDVPIFMKEIYKKKMMKKKL